MQRRKGMKGKILVIDPSDMYRIKVKLDLAKLLSEQGYFVEVYCQHSKQPDAPNGKQSERFFVHRIDSEGEVGFLLKLLSKTLKNDYDLIIGHDRAGLRIANFVATLKRSKLVYHNHHFVSKDEITSFKENIVKYLETTGLQRADLVICSHKEHAKIIELENNLDKYPLTIFPTFLKSGTKVDKTSPGLKAELSKRGYKCEYIVAQNNGIAPFTHTLELVQSVKAWKQNVCLVITGSTPDSEYFSEIQKFIEKNNLQKQVYFTGFLTNKMLYKYLLDVDVGVLFREPSTVNRTFYASNVLVDYLWSGTPIVAQNIDSLQQIVEKRNCGITISPKPNLISKKINDLTSNPQKLNLFADRCKMLFNNELCLEYQAQPLINELDKLLQ